MFQVNLYHKKSIHPHRYVNDRYCSLTVVTPVHRQLLTQCSNNRYSPTPVICLTRYIPLPWPPSSILVFIIPMMLFGLGLPPWPIFVGLAANCLVGLKPPPVNCLMSAASELANPVNCRANVVAPVYCVIVRNGAWPDPTGRPLRIPVVDGGSGVVVRTGDACGEVLKPEGSSD